MNIDSSVLLPAKTNRDEPLHDASHGHGEEEKESEMPETWTHHGVLLRVEEAINIALDLEDISLLITNLTIDPQTRHLCSLLACLYLGVPSSLGCATMCFCCVLLLFVARLGRSCSPSGVPSP